MVNEQHRLALNFGSLVKQYRIDEILGSGGYGIVYKATDTNTGRVVALKEYLPTDISVREQATVTPLSRSDQELYADGLQRFLAEARQIKQFGSHPNIVECLDFFEANGTAYLVMKYEHGITLAELLSRREEKRAPLSELQILDVMLPLLDGIRAVHAAGVLHRDIKPGNILIRRDTEEPVLIDFGAAKQNYSQHSKSMAPYSVGYAAIEQVEEEGRLGPWTDIYALGGVMWRMISGRNPQAVEARLSAKIRNAPDPLGNPATAALTSYSAGLLAIIERCLALTEEQRYQSADELVAALSALSSASASHWQPAAGSATAAIATAAANSVSANASSPRPASTNSVSPTLPAATDKPCAKWPLAVVAGVGVITTIAAFFIGAGFCNYQCDDPISSGPLLPPIRPDGDYKIGEVLQARLKDGGAGPRFVVLPSSEFEMGSSNGDQDEQPVHSVTIAKTIAMMETEVTFADYDRFAQATGREQPYDEEWGRQTRPVIHVSWYDASAYAVWLSEQTGNHYRLPTEAEWEYAARVGTSSNFSFGDCITTNLANYDGNYTLDGCSADTGNYREQTLSVKSFAANDFGLYDMHGNVWEWVADCLTSNYDNASAEGAAASETDCENSEVKVIRGGSWYFEPGFLRSSFRNGFEMANDDDDVGFRLVQEL
ncbi:bifunctional serine/threonine-protein kinase/formylglycine-generating enzyme family protein [Halioxenophilus sp. WMMB6]|uniref:bifunctional serine/threonine-protein kinase/formylglycine-generating enzyme family protein n=1 Tax=Halioxenophilus sp. WMMB6 TaxID=3073815 RepID=UPI00295F314C|nr:bifunctional serine/threonine-protein kinase/formylglycine-generating enzyme family protein [Halioxenophilus sp. WMMB6]